MKVIIAVLFFASSVFADQLQECAENNPRQHFFLTYLRSGTNLTAGYLQALSGKPIMMFEPLRLWSAENRIGLPLDYSLPILYRTHEGLQLLAHNRDGNKLLFVIRNYKENVIRNRYPSLKNDQDLLHAIQAPSRDFAIYMQNLEVYDQWDPEYRLLVHYEDMIARPKDMILKILNFFDIDDVQEIDDDFLDEIRLRVLASYHEQHQNTGGSHSKGEDIHYHSKQFSVETLNAIDHYLKKTYPNLWERYLKQYKTDAK